MAGSLTGSIFSAYRAPRQTVRGLQNVGEPTLLFFAFLACFLAFVSQWPTLALLAQETVQRGDEFAGPFAAQFVGTMLFGPIMLYVLAGLSHLILRALGAKGSGRDARLALFWSALVAMPLVLLAAAFQALIPGTIGTVTGAIAAAVFLWQWIICLHEVEFA